MTGRRPRRRSGPGRAEESRIPQQEHAFVSCLILAAGTSSRLGRPKQLLDLHGRPTLRHVCDAALASPVEEVLVVLGHLADRIAPAIPRADRIRVVCNDRYLEGQSTSLRAGLRALDARAEAIVVLLGDQPEIRPATVAAVVDAWRRRGTPVVQASYAGHPAHPVVFDRSVWPELDRATGDEGARGILSTHPEWTRLIDVEGPRPRDIDTEEDYDRVRADFRAHGPGPRDGPPGSRGH